jgi:glutamine synthetase
MSDKSKLLKFLNLPQRAGQALITYIWIDGSGEHLRSKTMTLTDEPHSVDDLPWWHFNGSSTGQADSLTSSDVLLKPVAMFKDPFLPGGKNKLVMCETYNPDKTPHGMIKIN